MVSTDSFAITVNVLSTCAAEDTPTERRASDSQTLAERVVHCALVKLTGQAWQQTGLLIAITGEQGWVGATSPRRVKDGDSSVTSGYLCSGGKRLY